MNEMSPVAAAVEPLRLVATERARQDAFRIAEAYLADFVKDPKLAEYPRNSGMMSKREYEHRMRTYRTIRSLTKQIRGVTVLEPVTYVRCEEAIERFVKDAMEMACLAYTAFVQKLEKKIGECNTAELQGDHVWGYSILRVTKDSTTECWKTHQIVNVSKHGKLFNQWPTRKMK